MPYIIKVAGILLIPSDFLRFKHKKRHLFNIIVLQWLIFFDGYFLPHVLHEHRLKLIDCPLFQRMFVLEGANISRLAWQDSQAQRNCESVPGSCFAAAPLIGQWTRYPVAGARYRY